MNSLFYIIFHGNLAFSSIEEEDIGEVIDRCYFPLLELAKKKDVKIGLELSGYSLEKIKELRPKWIDSFKKLYSKNKIELIGSGYMQLIGPLVPYEVNLQNQLVGLEVYKEILNIVPKIAFVNEQVFSKSMVDIYNEVGYEGLAMEWNNAYSIHSTWYREYEKSPVLVKGEDKKSILPLIWTDSILFQQFQRVVHEELNMEEYSNFVNNYIEFGYKTIPIYSSDIEIFDYRPGRFETEASIKNNEWDNISNIVKNLQTKGDFILPSQSLQFLQKDIVLDLPNSEFPILVKKQEKYSLSRWAACGRGANYINTLCYRYMLDNGIDKNLLKYWGSDFRTHTTLKKWNKAINFLTSRIKKIDRVKSKFILSNDIEIYRHDKFLIFENKEYKILFNLQKGLTLHKIYKNGKYLAFGTVKHGDMQHIGLGADFYTGTTTIESAQYGKCSDLQAIDEYSFKKADQHVYEISTNIVLGDIASEFKKWTIDFNKQEIKLYISLEVKKMVWGSIRAGTLTLLPQKKDDILWYECKNGGNKYERFYLRDNTQIVHPFAKSLLQSSRSGIGVTDGKLFFGTDKKVICALTINKYKSSPFVMLQSSTDMTKRLTRVFFGLQEIDDTLKEYRNKTFNLEYSVMI